MSLRSVSVTSPHPPDHSPGSYASRSVWSARDTACLLLSIAFMFAVALHMQHGRVFWEDEMLGWMLLRDPSWRHMTASWKLGADGGGFAFYLTGRWWFAIFGQSVLSFRMYSAVPIAAAFGAMWVIARRFYSWGIVAFAFILTWFTGPALFEYMAEGRFYGLMMFSTAAAIALYFYAAQKNPLPRGTYLLVFLAHALLTTSHLLGVVYSGTVIAAMIGVDILKGQRRPLLYLSGMLAWLLLIPSLPAIHASALVGKPHFWTKQPSVREFFALYAGLSWKAELVLGAMLLFTVLQLARRHTLRSTLQGRFSSLTPLYLLVSLMFLLPVLFFAEGFLGPPLCNGRYLLPIELVTPFFAAELATLAWPLLPSRLRARTGMLKAAASAALALILVFGFHYNAQNLHRDYTAALSADLPKGVPIVCEDAFTFTELIGREHDSEVRYTFLLDWTSSVAPDAPLLEVTQYHLMENWKKAGYFSGSIRYRRSFLEQTPVFYVLKLDDMMRRHFYQTPKKVERAKNIGNDLHDEFAVDPAYRVSFYKEIPLGEQVASVWQVERVKPDAAGRSSSWPGSQQGIARAGPSKRSASE